MANKHNGKDKTTSTSIYFVDATNICYWKDTTAPTLSVLLELLLELNKQKGKSFYCIFDANTHYKLPDNEKDIFKKLLELSDFFYRVAGGKRADDFVLELADSYNAPVISNDNYNDPKYSKYKWKERDFEPTRLFMGEVLPVMGKHHLILSDLDLHVVLEKSTEELYHTLLKVVQPKKRIIGKIKFYNSKEGWGQITYENDIYFNKGSLPPNQSISEGEEVEITIGENEKGLCVNRIKSIPENEQNRVLEGVVDFYDEQKQFGTIKSDGFEKSLFFYKSYFFDTSLRRLKIGQEVQFNKGTNRKGDCAINIKIIGENLEMLELETDLKKAKKQLSSLQVLFQEREKYFQQQYGPISMPKSEFDLVDSEESNPEVEKGSAEEDKTKKQSKATKPANNQKGQANKKKAKTESDNPNQKTKEQGNNQKNKQVNSNNKNQKQNSNQKGKNPNQKQNQHPKQGSESKQNSKNSDSAKGDNPNSKNQGQKQKENPNNKQNQNQRGKNQNQNQNQAPSTKQNSGKNQPSKPKNDPQAGQKKGSKTNSPAKKDGSVPGIIKLTPKKKEPANQGKGKGKPNQPTKPSTTKKVEPTKQEANKPKRPEKRSVAGKSNKPVDPKAPVKGIINLKKKTVEPAPSKPSNEPKKRPEKRSVNKVTPASKVKEPQAKVENTKTSKPTAKKEVNSNHPAEKKTSQKGKSQQPAAKSNTKATAPKKSGKAKVELKPQVKETPSKKTESNPKSIESKTGPKKKISKANPKTEAKKPVSKAKTTNTGESKNKPVRKSRSTSTPAKTVKPKETAKKPSTSKQQKAKPATNSAKPAAKKTASTKKTIATSGGTDLQVKKAWWKSLNASWKKAFNVVLENGERTAMPDADSLGKLLELKRLSFTKTSKNKLSFPIKDLSGVSKLQELTNLNLQGHEVKDVSGIEHLKFLNYINLSQNNLSTDIKGKVQKLKIRTTKV